MTAALTWLGNISIHPPRGGRDGPGRGLHRGPGNFNPPSPWGEGPGQLEGEDQELKFQSTLPVGGGTVDDLEAIRAALFQSTLPVGGGTDLVGGVRKVDAISIHPPRGGRDKFSRREKRGHFISIHPPRGGRDSTTFKGIALRSRFQSTLPVGGGTATAYFRAHCG